MFGIRFADATRLSSIGLAVVVMAVGAHLVAQRGVTGFTDADWPRFAGDYAGTKFSKLTQINTTNVSTLVKAWTFEGVGTQQTPIAIGGVMYASTPTGVVALDADTGSVIWRYGAPPVPGGRGGGGRRARTPPAGAAAPAEGAQDGELARGGGARVLRCRPLTAGGAPSSRGSPMPGDGGVAPAS